MKTIKIFLASSSELESDRREFEIFISRKNQDYIQQEIFLKLVLWENFIDAMSATRLQDEYNKAIADCDIFVSLFHTKVGKYTEEEFLKALETFKKNEKPLIYTYFKDAAVNMSEINDNILSLLNFKRKLSDLGHFYTNFADINELKYKFGEQLTKVLPNLTDIEQNNINNQPNSEQNNQHVTNIEQNFYGNVGAAAGNVAGDQNLKNTNASRTSENRNITLNKGNYNENIKGDYIEGNKIDQSRNLNISGGTINASGAGAFNLGNISGTVANTINQIPSSTKPDELKIEDLLTQLRATLEDPQLSEDDTTEILKQIEILTKTAQNLQDATMKKKAQRAIKYLEVIAEEVEPTSQLAMVCPQILPQILTFLS